jgi:hypothetical protein
MKCVNCKSAEHGSLDKKCTTFVFEKEVKRLQVTKKLAYKDARNQILAMAPLAERPFSLALRLANARNAPDAPNNEPAEAESNTTTCDNDLMEVQPQSNKRPHDAASPVQSPSKQPPKKPHMTTEEKPTKNNGSNNKNNNRK